jgi:sugar fermentation stimulation protein A
VLLPPLTKATLLNRYKRFLADLELESGEMVTAHCPNTGSMKGCWAPGVPAQISHSENPKRKLAWTLERVDMGQGWIGVHTGRTNAVIAEAIKAGVISSLSGYSKIGSEVNFAIPDLPRCRFDFLLSGGRKADAWVEVKNVTLLDGDRLKFPDAVTERGRKHLEALGEACSQGYRGVMIYALNRPEGEVFSPADAIDPHYGATLRRVVKESGVELFALRITHLEQSMKASDLVEIVLD